MLHDLTFFILESGIKLDFLIAVRLSGSAIFARPAFKRFRAVGEVSHTAVARCDRKSDTY